jgi:hypothetical protein
MKKFILLLTAAVFMLGATSVQANQLFDGTEELNGHKVYNYFNGDQPTGPSRAYSKLESMETSEMVEVDGNTTVKTSSVERTFATYCPPGLAKSECARRGHVITYKKGQIIPKSINYMSVSNERLAGLPMAPEGTQYVTMGRNIYLVNNTRKILNVVPQESAMISETIVETTTRPRTMYNH